MTNPESLRKAREILHGVNFIDDDYDEEHRERAVLAVATVLQQKDDLRTVQIAALEEKHRAALQEARTCDVCAGTDLVCAEGWRKERDKLKATLAARDVEIASLKETVEVMAEGTGSRALKSQVDTLSADLAACRELLKWSYEQFTAIQDIHHSCEQPTEKEESEVHRMFNLAQEGIQRLTEGQKETGDEK